MLNVGRVDRDLEGEFSGHEMVERTARVLVPSGCERVGTPFCGG